jgi:hypothetical protein
MLGGTFGAAPCKRSVRAISRKTPRIKDVKAVIEAAQKAE